MGVEMSHVLEGLTLAKHGHRGVLKVGIDGVLVFLVLGGGGFAKKGNAGIQVGILIKLSGVE